MLTTVYELVETTAEHTKAILVEYLCKKRTQDHKTLLNDAGAKTFRKNALDVSFSVFVQTDLPGNARLIILETRSGSLQHTVKFELP